MALVDPTKNQLSVTTQCDLAVNTVSEILSDTSIQGVTDLVNEKMQALTQTAMELMNRLKYALNEQWLDEELIRIKGAYISGDQTDWSPTKLKMGIAFGPTTAPKMLTEKTAQALQQQINKGITPFLALKHLHRARGETIPRYMWIEATIAAELAIKEFFIRLKPDVEGLLLELPSPPLGSMYGKILKSYIGEVFPRYNKLAEGATTRNKLIHRPEEMPITLHQAAEYVEMVEEAIFFLQSKLYPGDPLMNLGIRGKIKRI